MVALGVIGARGGEPVRLFECLDAFRDDAHAERLRDAALGGAANLVEAPQGCTVPGGTLSADPVLRPLEANGGSTMTMNLGPGSPAFDTGSNPAALANDQRGAGFARDVGGPDIGAFEAQRRIVVAKGVSPASDPGKWDLLIDGAKFASAVGDGGQTPVVSSLAGSASVAESPSGSTDASLYDTTIACAAGNGSGAAVTATPAGSGQWTLSGAPLGTIRCTITDTRKPPPVVEQPTVTPPVADTPGSPPPPPPSTGLKPKVVDSGTPSFKGKLIDAGIRIDCPAGVKTNCGASIVVTTGRSSSARPASSSRRASRGPYA